MRHLEPTAPIWLLLPTHMAYTRDIARGAVSRLRTSRYEVRIAESDDRYVLTHMRASGFLLFSGLTQTVAAARERHLPTVNVSGRLNWRDLPFASVLPDNEVAAQMAGAHLLQHGYRHLAYLTSLQAFFSQERAAGLRAAALAAGATFTCPPGGTGSVRARSQVKSLPRFTGVLISEDLYARRVLEACHDLARTVPGDLALVSIDNDDMLCESLNPSLSSVDLNGWTVGETAAGLLLGLLAGGSAPAEPIRVRPRGIVARASSAAIASSDELVCRAAALIKTQSGANRGVAALADDLHVSRRTLERRFLLATGQPIGRFQSRYRLHRARQLLTETALPIKVIATQTGFGSVTYFTAQFRRTFGQSPAAYRRQGRSASFPSWP